MKKIISFALAIIFVLGLVPAIAAADSAQTGSFTAAFINVDGLPARISYYTVNSKCPGTSGTSAMSSLIANNGWSIVGVAEDFNYHSTLISALGGYSTGTWMGKVTASSNNTDGLGLLTTGDIYSESNTQWGTKSGSRYTIDTLAKLGYRFYQIEQAEGVVIDVYVFELDNGTGKADKTARSAQLTQLVNAITASDNSNPIIIMGDANSLYSEGLVQSRLVDVLNSDGRFTAIDACRELGGAETDNKIIYVNNIESNVKLYAESFRVASEFVNSRGQALADSYPVVVEFSYSLESGEEAHVHDYYLSDHIDPSCTEDGGSVYSCECGDGYFELIPAAGHSFAPSIYVDPTCSSEGYTFYSCTECGAGYKADFIGYAEHDYVLIDTIGADCTIPGQRVYSCSVCGDIQTEEIPVLGHDYIISASSASSCTEPGSVTMSCTRCGDSYSEESGVAGHVFSTETVAPGCEEVGYTVYTCLNCGESEIGAFVAPNGHTYSEGICTACGAADPDYVAPEETEETVYTLGSYISKVSGLYDGMFVRITNTYNQTGRGLAHTEELGLTSVVTAAAAGAVEDASLIWKVTMVNGGITLSFDRNGRTYYLSRTSTITSGGLELVVSDTPFVFNVSEGYTKASRNKLIIGMTVGTSSYSVACYNGNYVARPSGGAVYVTEAFAN